MKIQYLVKPNGDIIRKPCKDSFVRERKALKEFTHRISEGTITHKDAKLSYKSWRGNIAKYDCKKSIQAMDRIYECSIGEMA